MGYCPFSSLSHDTMDCIVTQGSWAQLQGPRHGQSGAMIRPSVHPTTRRCERGLGAVCAAQAGSGCAHCTPDSVLSQCTILSHCLGHCSRVFKFFFFFYKIKGNKIKYFFLLNMI